MRPARIGQNGNAIAPDNGLQHAQHIIIKRRFVKNIRPNNDAIARAVDPIRPVAGSQYNAHAIGSSIPPAKGKRFQTVIGLNHPRTQSSRHNTGDTRPSPKFEHVTAFNEAALRQHIPEDQR